MAQGAEKGFARRMPPKKRPKIATQDNDNHRQLGTVNKIGMMTEEGQDGEANNYPPQKHSKQNRRGPTDNKSVSIISTGHGRAGR